MLELRNVSGGYGRHTVLRDVNLVVPDNAVVALLGANGAGKTTLLRVASGMLPARSGELLLDGVDVTRWPAYRLARSGVCHVPEGRGIFRALSVRDNLRLGAPRSADLRAIPTATQAFPLLGERLAQQAGTLTSGQARADTAPPEASGFSVQASADAVKMDIQTGLFGGGFPGFPADEPPFEGSAAYTEAVYDDLGNNSAVASAPYPGEFAVGF